MNPAARGRLAPVPLVLAAVALLTHPAVRTSAQLLCPGARPASEPRASVAAPDVPKPAYLAPVCPQPFGLRIIRIADDPGRPLTLAQVAGTWGADARHHYSKDQPWSADGTLLALQNSGSPHLVFLDGETYRPRLAKCHDYPYYDDRWHPALIHAHERINVKTSDLMWYDVVACAATRHWTLPFAVVGLGMGEGNVSFDGRYVALSDGRQAFLVDMDPQPPLAPYPAQRIGPGVDVADCGVASGCSIDWVSVSPSGTYVVVAYQGDYVRIFDVDPATLAFAPRPMPTVYANCHGTAARGFVYDVGHADMTRDPFGGNEDVIVGQEHCHNAGHVVAGKLMGHVVKVRLRDGTITPLTDPTNEAYPNHISTRNYDRPGWAYVSYYPAPGRRFSDEIIAVKLDGSQAVERFAHSHTERAHCYRCEAHAVPARDGRRVLWASNWMVEGAGTGTAGVIQAYVVEARP
jgi:hypothetical protein